MKRGAIILVFVGAALQDFTAHAQNATELVGEIRATHAEVISVVTQNEALHTDIRALQAKMRAALLEQSCMDVATSVSRPLAYVMNRYLSDASAPHSLVGRKAAYERARAAYLKQVAGLVTDASLASDLDTIASRLSAVEKMLQPSLAGLADLLGQEEALSFLSSDLQQTILLGRAALRRIDQSQCPAVLRAPVTKLIAQVDAWSLRLARMHIALSDIVAKRRSLTSDLRRSVRVSLMQRQSRLLSKDIGEILAQIEELGRAERFLDRLGEWWFHAGIAQGEARGEVDAQQFEPALNTIEADLATAANFIAEARGYQLPAGAIETLVSAVEGKVTTLNRVKARLESEGWQKRFSTQSALAKRYGNVVGAKVRACAEAAATFEAKSVGVVDVSTYRFAEAAYKAVYNACAKRKP